MRPGKTFGFVDPKRRFDVIVRSSIAALIVAVSVGVAPCVASGYTVTGKISTFGPPNQTAETVAGGGYDTRACFAIRDDWSLGRMFRVHIPPQEATGWRSYHGTLEHCDWGPAEWTGRAIDISGIGAFKLHIYGGFPTEAVGSVTLISPRHHHHHHRRHRKHRHRRRKHRLIVNGTCALVQTTCRWDHEK